MIIACATDNKKELIPRHFGDANYYCIYQLTNEKFEFIKFIDSEPLLLNKKQYLEGASFTILRQPNC